MLLLTLVAFAFVLGVLIFVHELGHFIAAKAVGIAVPRFSIGFGPATPLRMRHGETEYVLAWFPLGGYVKMASREEQEMAAPLEGGGTDENVPPERLFESKPLWARTMVIGAGVTMNVLFAWFAYTALAATFGRTEDPITAVAHVEAGDLPAQAQALAALPAGARIVRVNGDTVRSWDDILAKIADPSSARLRFDFAGGLDPVILPIRGTEEADRAAIAGALFPDWPARIGGVAVGQPADHAGLKAGDRILSAGGVPMRRFYDLQQAVEAAVGDSLRLEVRRDDSTFAISVVPVEQTVTDPLTGAKHTAGRIGANPWVDWIQVRYGPIDAVVEGADHTWRDAKTVLFTIKGMIVRDISPRDLGGPIMIGQLSGQFARFGLGPLFAFMALLSVNLAILNLLPIPVLDGGHLVFLAIEGIRGKPLSLQARLRLTQMGMVVLLALMVFVFTNDILRLFGG